MRIDSLDGLRGLASVAVLFFHTCKMLQLFGPTGLYDLIPGVAAVIVFYAISGVVLALVPLQKLKAQERYDWFSYFPRRVIRLCVPLVAAIALGVLASFVADATGLDPRAEKPIDWQQGLAEVVRQIMMQFDVLFNVTDGQCFIDGTRFVRTNSPTWSMSWELWFSLALPLAVYVIWRTKRTWLGLCACACLVLLANATGYFPLRMCVMFVAGTYMAKDAAALTKARIPAPALAAALIGCVAVIELAGACASSGSWPVPAFLLMTLSDAACVALVALAMTSGFASRFLSTRPVRFLGKLSYSLYLTHVLVVGSVGPLLPRFGVEHPALIAAIIVVLSFSVAWLFWYLVERPSMLWSRKVGKQIQERP